MTKFVPGRRRCLKLLGGLAAGAALAGLGGCARTGQPSPAAASTPSVLNTVSGAPVSLLMPGSADAQACARVSRQLSALTGPALGFSVAVEQLPQEEYSGELWRRMMLQEMPDVFYLPETLSLSGYIYENCICPLGSFLKTHPGLVALFSEQQWNCQKYYRIAYAVPARTSSCYQMGFLARSSLLQTLSAAPPDGVLTLEQLYGLLAAAREELPGVWPVVPHYGRVLPYLGQDPLNDGLGVLPGNQGDRVENWYAGSEYAQLCAAFSRWEQEGLILENACLRTESALELMKVCNGLGFLGKISPDNVEIAARSLGEALTPLPLTPLLQNSTAAAGGWCLPITASQKDAALALLEFLYADAAAARLFVCGEEGLDDLPETEHRWENLCVGLASTSGGAGDAALPEAEAQTSPAYGFVFNSAQCASQASACGLVQNKFHNALMCGMLAPEEALPVFLRQLEQAGIAELLAAKQRQLDNWLAAKR